MGDSDEHDREERERFTKSQSIKQLFELLRHDPGEERPKDMYNDLKVSKFFPGYVE
jgi:hypothetical protein